MVEHVFEPRLAVVKRAVERQRVHVAFHRCGHLAALDLGHAAMRVEDKDIDRVQPAKGLNRGRAGVTRGCAHDGHTVATARERFLKHLANQLHREVFERQRRTMKQLKQEMPRSQLHQWRAGIVAKTCIGLCDEISEYLVGKRITNKRAHDAVCNFFVGQPMHRPDLSVAQRRDRFRHIKPAVPGQARQHRIFKSKRRGFATG